MLSLLPFSRQHSRFVWNNTVCFCFGLKMITFHFYQIYREILAFTSLTWILCLKRLNQDVQDTVEQFTLFYYQAKTRAAQQCTWTREVQFIIQSIYQTYEHRKYLLLAVGGEMLPLICCPDGLWPPVRALCENTPPTLQLLPDMAGTGSLSLSEIVLCKLVAIYLQHSTLCVNPSHCGLILLTRSVIMSIHCN